MVKRWKLHSQQLFLMDWFSYVIISWFVGCENSLTTKWNKSQHTPSVTKSVRNGWLVIHSVKSCKIEFRTNQRKTFPQVFVDHPTVGLLESIWSNRILIKKSSIIHCIYDVAHPKLIDQKMQGMPPKHEGWLEPRSAKMSGTIWTGPYREGPGITQRPNPPPGVCQDIDHPSHPYLSNKKRIFFVPDDMFAPSIDV
mgnify:CR=1 FL=1